MFKVPYILIYFNAYAHKTASAFPFQRVLLS